MLCPAEGLVLTVYSCPAGFPTIGYGHKLTERELSSGVYSRGITRAQAEEILDDDIGVARAAVLRHVTGLNENQLDALTCLVYNVGEGVFLGEAPKMTAALKEGDWETAAREMLDINHADGKVMSCLTTRRKMEAALFLSPVVDISFDAVMSLVGLTLDGLRAEMIDFSPSSRERDG